MTPKTRWVITEHITHEVMARSMEDALERHDNKESQYLDVDIEARMK